MTDQHEATSREAADFGDADLVLRTRSGDAGAFGELWRRHYRSGITVARSVSPGTDADDLVQEAYTRIYQSILRGGGPTGSFRAYLFTSIRNTAAGWGRSRRETTIDELETLEDPTTTEQATAESLDRSLTHQAFRSLPTRWQEVLWYSEIEAMKPSEIAPLLGLKATAVAQLTFRAREGLREAWIQAHLRSVTDGSDCAWAIERLGAYARNNMGRRDYAKLDAHLATCTRCAIVASEAKEVSSRLALVLIPLTVGVAGTAGYLAMLQTGGEVVALAAMPSTVVQGAAVPGVVVNGAAVHGAVAAGSTGAGGVTVGSSAAATAGSFGAGSAAAGATGTAVAAGTAGATVGATAVAAGAGVATAGMITGAGIAGLAAAGLIVAGTVAAAVALPPGPADVSEVKEDAAAVSAPSSPEPDTLLEMATDATVPISQESGPSPSDIPVLLAEHDGAADSDDQGGDDTDGGDGGLGNGDGTGNGGTSNGTGNEGTSNGTGTSGASNGTGNGGTSNGTGNGGVSNGSGNGGVSNGTGNGGTSNGTGSAGNGSNGNGSTNSGTNNGNANGSGTGNGTNSNGQNSSSSSSSSAGSNKGGTAPQSGSTNSGSTNTGNVNSGSANSNAGGNGGGSSAGPSLPDGTPSFVSSSSSTAGGQTTVQITVAGEAGSTVQARVRGSVRASATVGGSGQAVLAVQASAQEVKTDARVELRYVDGTHAGPPTDARLSDLL